MKKQIRAFNLLNITKIPLYIDSGLKFELLVFYSCSNRFRIETAFLDGNLESSSEDTLIPKPGWIF
jgi:hypothetical protein